MRFKEFGLLTEYKAGTSDKQLRNDIIAMLKTEDDRDMLDKIYTALHQGGLEDRIKAVLSKDEDVKGKIDVLAGLIMQTGGTYVEIDTFLKQFKKGFIDIAALKSSGGTKPFSSWFKGDDFAKRVFDKLAEYDVMGIGPGEFALAVMSPKIKFAGRSRTVAGDLEIDGTAVEVKTKKDKGGRFHDPRKANYDQATVKSAFEKVGISFGGADSTISAKSITAKTWVSSIRDTLTPAKIKKLVPVIIKGAFRYVTDAKTNKLAKALTSGSFEQIRLEWGILSYQNYIKVSKFDAMLMIDLPGKQTLYFKNISDVSSLLQFAAPQLCGPEQSVAPQVTFQLGAGGGWVDGGEVSGDGSVAAVSPARKAAKKKSPEPTSKMSASKGGKKG